MQDECKKQFAQLVASLKKLKIDSEKKYDDYEDYEKSRGAIGQTIDFIINLMKSIANMIISAVGRKRYTYSPEKEKSTFINMIQKQSAFQLSIW